MGNYWWIIANPEDHKNGWNWTTSQDVGKVEEWVNVYNKDGHYNNNFQLVKEDDEVIGYNSGKQHQIVALAVIKKPLHDYKEGKAISIMKVRNLKPLDYSTLKEHSSTNELRRKGRIQGTIVSITKAEYYELIRISKIL